MNLVESVAGHDRPEQRVRAVVRGRRGPPKFAALHARLHEVMNQLPSQWRNSPHWRSMPGRIAGRTTVFMKSTGRRCKNRRSGLEYKGPRSADAKYCSEGGYHGRRC